MEHTVQAGEQTSIRGRIEVYMLGQELGTPGRGSQQELVLEGPHPTTENHMGATRTGPLHFGACAILWDMSKTRFLVSISRALGLLGQITNRAFHLCGHVPRRHDAV